MSTPPDRNSRLPGQSGRGWQQDLLASLVVFLVALPLCMGVALASGAPIAAGLVTGIVGGLVVGTLAGSPMQVSGPAAGLTVICGEIIRQHGMNAFGMAVLFAGFLQLTAGICRLGQWFRAVSPAVIHGMLSGIGILILCGQLHVLVDERPRENAPKNILAIPESLGKGLAVPAIEKPDVRSSRISLLKAASRLAAGQSTLRGKIDRAAQRILVRDSELVQESRPDLPSIRSMLDPLIHEQEILATSLSALSNVAEQSPLVAAGGEPAEKVMETFRIAAEALSHAKNDLLGNDAQRVIRSQQEATQAVNAVAAGLKSHDWAGKVGLLAVVVIFAWQYLARGKWKLVPAPLLAIVVATLVAQLFQLPVLYVDVPADLRDGLTLPTMAMLGDLDIRQMLAAGVVLSIVASAETLLCATAVDQMHRGPRTRYDRELSAQGIGNLLCGFLGVLPMTGVIVRSAANVQAGARSRLSAILHGLWLLMFSVALAPILRLIPTAALAGILVFTGFRLIDFRGFRHLWKENRAEAAIFLITMIVIVMDDLLTGVLTGLALSAVKLLVRFSQLDIEVLGEKESAASGTTIRLVGAATFLRLPKLASWLERVPPGTNLHVDVSEMDYIDRACMELLQNWSRQHEATGGQLTIDWQSLHARFQTSRPRMAGTGGNS